MDYELVILNFGQELNALNDNVDVEIKMKDGRVFSATFFTIENIKSLFQKFKETGESANGLYVWAVDMVIVEQLTENVIRESIDDLIENGEINHACTEITPE